MKLLVVILGIFFISLLNSGFAQSAKRVISISNPLPSDRKEEIIALEWKDILSKYPGIDTANFKIIDIATKKELPWQLEFKGEKTLQNLLIQLDVPGHGNLKLEIRNGKSSPIHSKTFGRYVPERKDDFAWENDKIAFRMYGKSLELIPSEMAYGMDVWVKRTDKLILNERYKRGEYHIDHGDGMDYYHVGKTLGDGDIAPYVKDSIYYPKNYRRWKVLDNGPLRTTFELEYDEWDVNGTKVSVVKLISLDAGSQLSRVEAKFSSGQTSPLPVVIGLAKRKEQGSMQLDEKQGIMAYWEPKHGEDGTTGVGSILCNPLTRIQVTDAQILSHTVSLIGKPVIYYTGACWDKANKITTSKAWFDYMQTFKECLSNPLKILIE
jgi:Domain of unknown function (DUF4861)